VIFCFSSIKFSTEYVVRTARPHTLQQFLTRLRQSGDLVDITASVDPALELAEIHRRIVKQNGPAILFSNVKGSMFPVVSNLFSSKRRLAIAFGDDVEEKIHQTIQVLTNDFPTSLADLWKHRKTLLPLFHIGTKQRHSAPVLEHSVNPVDLHRIPFIKCWPEDGGSFLTLPLVYTESPSRKGGNLGMYRIQRFDTETTGLHWQIAKGGGYHFMESEELEKDLPITIFLGGPPALIVSAIAPLPENISELLLCSFLMMDKVDICTKKGFSLPIIAECDAALVGFAKAHERRLEGPFGDHYGYQSPALPFPVFHCTNIFHRKDAVIPATVVGRPLQEDAYIGRFVQSILRPFVSLLIPSVQELYTYPETGFHPLAAVKIKERYEKEGLSAALRLLGEGQLSLTKILLLTDQLVRIDDIKALLPALLERLRPEEDLIVLSYTSFDTLDMTGPRPNRGSKAIMIGTGEKRRTLPHSLRRTPPSIIRTAIPYTAGCLVIDGPTHHDLPDPQPLLSFDAFADWPLLLLVDNATDCCSSTAEFLWQAFTRFEPASDIYAKDKAIRRNGVSFSFPLLIDARMKPSYPAPLLADPQTIELVDRRWHEYFPSTSQS
jgi:4-hydroxybenzoate decarboxylase subunit C